MTKGWIIVIGLLIAALVMISHIIFFDLTNYDIHMARLCALLTSILTNFITLIMLSTINLKLISYLTHAMKQHNDMVGKKVDKRGKTLILVVLILIFVAFGIPRCIFLLVSYMRKNEFTNTGWLSAMGNVTWILMFVNTSINFYVYVMYYKQFRKCVAELLFYCNTQKRHII